MWDFEIESRYDEFNDKLEEINRNGGLDYVYGDRAYNNVKKRDICRNKSFRR